MNKILLSALIALICNYSIAQWSTNGTNVYYNSGHVGIGTSTPTTLWSKVLQVYDFNNAALSVKTPVADWQILTAGNGGLDFRDISGGGNVGRLFIASNGNIGIGTNNPGTYKLAVEGIMGARKVKVTQAPWADYVFDDQYKLLQLREVAAFIKKHKHLPEVPTTKEIEANGLDLGDNQALLLKKIEELTLYLIDVNTKVEQLQQENLELKKRIKKLDK